MLLEWVTDCTTKNNVIRNLPTLDRSQLRVKCGSPLSFSFCSPNGLNCQLFAMNGSLFFSQKYFIFRTPTLCLRYAMATLFHSKTKTLFPNWFLASKRREGKRRGEFHFCPARRRMLRYLAMLYLCFSQKSPSPINAFELIDLKTE